MDRLRFVSNQTRIKRIYKKIKEFRQVIIDSGGSEIHTDKLIRYMKRQLNLKGIVKFK